MLLEIFDITLLKNIVSIFLVGFIIKIMDDIIDENHPEHLYKAALPYVILIFIISTIIEYKTTTGLFMASYIVGMYSDINDTLLTGLKGYQEAVIVAILGVIFLGRATFIFCLTVIIAVQLIDDVFDIELDKRLGHQNLAIKYGKVEIFILSLIFCILSLMLDPIKGLIVLCAVPIINILFNKLKGEILNCE
ncbi:MAG TPA: hypothetical protein GXZ31_05355 [Thermoanaerobacterales bacterium]|nr:hypothetical protein [Thermoanaerobacterales bacterium]